MRSQIRIVVLTGLLGGLSALPPSLVLAATSLEVEQSGGAVMVRWPVEAGYYILEETTALTEPIQWAQSVVNPVQQGVDWVVTVLPSERRRFFRLRQVVATASFRVERHTPLDGATEVGVTYRPQIFFSQPVNPATLTSNNFYASYGGEPWPANIVPANDGSFAWLFFKQPMPSGARVRVTVDGSSIGAAQGGDALDADGDGLPGGVLEFEFTTVSLAVLPGTSLSGIVVDPGPDKIPRSDDDLRPGPDGKLGTADDVLLLPIEGVKVYLLGRENEVVRTGANGRFHFDAVPVGDVKVVIDGTSALRPPSGMYFPEMVIDAHMVLGKDNSTMTNGAEVYLPRLANTILQTVNAATTNLIKATPEGAGGLSAFQRNQLSIQVAPNSLIGMDGQPLSTGQIGISTVPPEIVRDMLPLGVLQHTFDITVQAPGIATFATPAPMSFPNVFNAAPGTKLNFLSFDHTTRRLVIEGTATVSADGASVRTDPGTGVTHPGWHGLPPPGAANDNPCAPANPSVDRPPQPTALVAVVRGATDPAAAFRPLANGHILAFADDARFFLTFGNAALKLKDREDPCSTENKKATPLIVGVNFDQRMANRFLTGFNEQRFALLPGQTKTIGVGMVPHEKDVDIETDILYGLKVAINYYQQAANGTLTLLQSQPTPLYVYRYVDVSDTNSADGILEFPQTLNDGPGGVIRQREFKYLGEAGAMPMLQPEAVDFGMGLTVNGISTLYFDPRTTALDIHTPLRVIAPGGRNAQPDSLALSGEGTPKHQIDFNSAGFMQALEEILADGQPTAQQLILTSRTPDGVDSFFTINFMGQSTLPLPYAISASQVQSALEGLLTVGTGNVTVTREDRAIPAGSAPPTYEAVFTIKFRGRFNGMLLANVRATVTGLTLINSGSEWLFRIKTATAIPPAFFFGFTINGVPTKGVLGYDASAADIRSALEGLPAVGRGGVTVTENPDHSLPDSTLFARSFIIRFTRAPTKFETGSTEPLTGGLVQGLTGSLITPNERALFSTPQLRQELATEIRSRAPARFAALSSGIEMIDRSGQIGAPGPSVITVAWRNAATDGALATTGVPGGNGVDNSEAVAELIANQRKYPRVLQNFYLSKALNQKYASVVEVYPNRILQQAGLFPLEQTREQFINNVSGIICHEVAHTLGATHTTDATNRLAAEEVQTLTLSGGSPGDTFTLSFAGFPTAPLSRDASETMVRDALEGIRIAAPGYVNVGGFDGGPFTIAFTGQLRGTDVPEITATATGGLTVTPRTVVNGVLEQVFFQNIMLDGKSGSDDLMGKVFKRYLNDPGYGFISPFSLDVIKVGLKLGWSPAEAQRVLRFFTKFFATGGFVEIDIDEPGVTPIIKPHLAIENSAGELMPRVLNLGSVKLGNPAATTQITLFNFGQQDLTLTAVSSLAANSPFAVSTLPPGQVLNLGTTLALRISFAPTTSGSFEEILRIDSNDEVGPYELKLQGTGVSAGARMRVRVINNNVGGAAIGAPARIITPFATIENEGSMPLAISAIRIAARRLFTSFQVQGLPPGLSESQPLVIQPAQSFSFNLSFIPTQVGLLPVDIEIVSNDPDARTNTIHALGTGLATGGDPLDSLDYGNDYVAFETPDLANSPVLRMRSDANGNWSFFLPPEQRYHYAIFDPISGLIAHGYGITAGSGTNTPIGIPVSLASTAPDSDGDGLPDDIEWAIGTNPAKADTDGNGLDDFTEISQGLDPLGGRAFPTGVIGSVALQGEAKEIVIESAPNDANKLTAYVATGNYGLAIVDVSQFNQPVVLSELDLPGDATDVAVDAALQIAAVSAGAAGLHLVDVSDAMLPKLIRTVELSAGAAHVALRNGTAYVASGDDVVAIDLLSGQVVQKLSQFGAEVKDLAVDGAWLDVITAAFNFHSLALTDQGMSLRGSASLAAQSKRIVIGNAVAYVIGDTEPNGGYTTIALTTPAAPRFIAGIGAPLQIGGLAFNGSGLGVVVGKTDGSNVCDVITALDPQSGYALSTRFQLPAPPNSVAVASGTAFVADGTNGLVVVNYSGFDTQNRPPAVTLTLETADQDPNTPGIQIAEGTIMTLRATASDDVQVRHVELLVNGQLVQTDPSFPFAFAVVAARPADQSAQLRIQARASDTGGNAGLSAPIVIDLRPDTTPPRILLSSPTNTALVFRDFNKASIKFSEPLARPTITPLTVELVNSLGQRFAPVSFMLMANDQVLTLSFNELPPDCYRVLFHGQQIKDLAGNSLGTADTAVSFAVAPLNTNEFTIRWINPGSGHWTNVMNWSPNRLPVTNDNVLIAPNGLVPNATVLLPNTIDIGPTNSRIPGFGPIRFSNLVSIAALQMNYTTIEASGTILVNNRFDQTASTLNGGRLQACPAMVFQNGPAIHPATLLSGALWNGVTLRGELVITNGLQIVITNGLNLEGNIDGSVRDQAVGDVSAAVLQFFGTNTVGGSGTLKSVTFQTYAPVADYPDNTFATAGGGVKLTLGPGITVLGQSAIFGSDEATIINQGTMRAEVVRQNPTRPLTMVLAPGCSFINEGIIEVTNRSRLLVQGGTPSWYADLSPVPQFINRHTLRVASGALLQMFSVRYLSANSIAESTSVFDLGCEIPTEPGRVSTFSGGGGWVTRAGPNVLGVAEPTGPSTFSGGTVTLTDGARLYGPALLQGLTLNGSMDIAFNAELIAAGVSQPNWNTVEVRQGLTLNGTLTLNLPDYDGLPVRALLGFGEGYQFLEGKGTIVFGNAPGNALGRQLISNQHFDPLIIGRDVTVRGGSFGIGSHFDALGTITSSSPLDLRGTTVADMPGGTVSINPGSFQGIENTGSILALNGALLKLSGGDFVNKGTLAARGSRITTAFSGSWTNSGIVSIDPSSTIAVTGSVWQASSGALMIDLAGTQPGVTHGLFNVSGAANLGGTLHIGLANNFQPALGNTFNVINWSSRSGTFGSVTNSPLSNGLTLKLDYQPTQLRFTASPP